MTDVSTDPVVFSDSVTFTWPGHVFPTGKYGALADRLLFEQVVSGFVTPDRATREELLTCHTEAYLDELEGIAAGRLPQNPRFECPINENVLRAFEVGAGGTIRAARISLETRLAASLCGGFHHAYPDHGEGFCLLNDVVVAAKVLLDAGVVERVLVVDLDVHQGNGTAVAARDDARIFTFSMHQENNYPVKEASDLDIGLPDLTGDREYTEILTDALRRIDRTFAPDLVFYLAGADPYREDRLGGLDLTLDGLAARDRVVFDWAHLRRAAVTAVLAGGYAVREVDVVEIHFRMVKELLRRAR